MIKVDENRIASQLSYVDALGKLVVSYYSKPLPVQGVKENTFSRLIWCHPEEKKFLPSPTS